MCLAACAVLLASAGCSVVSPTKVTAPTLHTLDSSAWPPVAPPGTAAAAVPRAQRTLIVNAPQAAPGLDTRRMQYLRQDHQPEFFVNHAWLDTPARLLGPLLLQALRDTHRWDAVVLAPGAVAGDVRLHTTIVQLQQNFQMQPSRVQFTLRFYLSEEKTRRVIAWRDITTEVVASSDDPAGGVLAANVAVQRALAALAAFVRSADEMMPADPAR